MSMKQIISEWRTGKKYGPMQESDEANMTRLWILTLFNSIAVIVIMIALIKGK